MLIDKALGLILLTSATVLGQVAEILTPEPGTTLPSSTVTFTWTNQSTNYFLYVGSTGVGSFNIHNSGKISTTSRVVSGIPASIPIYVRLYTETSPGSNSYYLRDYTYNTDLDDDGILDTIDPRPTVNDSKVTVSGTDYTFQVLGSGRVATLQIPPALFDTLAIGMNTTQMRDLSTKVYVHFQDVFDFIIFTSGQSTAPPGATYVGRHFSVRNDTQGLGLSTYDQTALYGSAGRLQGAIHLTVDSGLRGGPSLHEIMHRWAAFLASVPSAASGHWGYCSVGGQLGGWKPGSLENLGGGTYRVRSPVTGNYGSFGTVVNGGNSLPYSQFELYLMGLIPITGLPDIQIANGFAWVDSSMGTFTASSITTVSMSTVVATDGARVPTPTTSQKNFRTLHVVLVNAPLTNGKWSRYDEDVFKFALSGDDGSSVHNFWEAVGGLATMQMDGLLNALQPLGLPKIQAIARTGINQSDVTLTLATAASTSYFLQRKTRLIDTEPWMTLQTGIVGTGGDIQVVDSGGGASPSRFYRFGVGSPPPQLAPIVHEQATQDGRSHEPHCPERKLMEASDSVWHLR